AGGEIARDLGVTLANRILAFLDEPPALKGQLARLGQAHVIERTEPHIPRSMAVALVAKNPTTPNVVFAVLAARDLRVQPAAMPQHQTVARLALEFAPGDAAFRPGSSHAAITEPLQLACHVLSRFPLPWVPMTVPMTARRQ